MFGFYPFSNTSFSGTEGEVLLLAVRESSGSRDIPTNRAQMALVTREQSAGTSRDSGQSGNGLGVAEASTGTDRPAVNNNVQGVVVEGAFSRAAGSLQLNVVPLRVVEVSKAEDRPPFVRSRWEFVQTSTGGFWTPVQTGE